MTMNKNSDEKVTTLGELVEKARFEMITTSALDGSLENRPMTIQEFADGVIRFITKRDAVVVQQGDNRQVNVAIAGKSSWVSVSGQGRMVTDPELKKRLWDAGNDIFADGGPDDPENVVFEVRPDSASYWDSPGAVSTILGMIKAKVTGEKPSVGEQQEVDLSRLPRRPGRLGTCLTLTSSPFLIAATPVNARIFPGRWPSPCWAVGQWIWSGRRLFPTAKTTSAPPLKRQCAQEPTSS